MPIGTIHAEQSRKPQLLDGLDFDAYALLDGVNASLLKQFRRSAAHARHEMERPRESSSMKMGTAVHAAALEPLKWKADYVVAPQLDRRTKEGKAKWASFLAESEERIVLTAPEYTDVHGMGEALLQHETAHALLSGAGRNEATVRWYEGDTPCKGRIDRMTTHAGHSWVIDVKTTRDASPREFSRDVAKYGYHISAAWYLRGLDAIAQHRRRFAFVCVENSAPYCVAVYELDYQALQQGDDEAMAMLARYRQAKKTNVWAGYPEGILPLQLPTWAIKESDHE